MSKMEGYVNHLAGVRYRVTGSGNLKTTVYSLSESRNRTMADVVMDSVTPNLPFVLTNFNSQGMQIEFRISEINETFTISKIVPYIKPVATGNPQ